MKKYSIAVLVVLLVLIIMLSGCEEEQKAATSAEKKGEIVLVSDVVELVNSSFERNERVVIDDVTDEKIIVVQSIDVSFLFHNIAGKDIKISVEAEFYNSNDELIGFVQGAREISLPKDYSEKAINTPTNTITYDGQNRDEVTKAVIIVNEL